MSALSSVAPIFFCSGGLVLIFHFSYFGNSQIIFLFPFLISFFSFLFLRVFVLLIFLPNKVLLSFVPHSFLSISSDWVFILNHKINISRFYSGKIIELSSLVWIFFSWNILWMIAEVTYLLFIFLVINLDINSLNQVYRNSFIIFFFSIPLKLLYFFLIEDFFPFWSILCSQILSFLLFFCFSLLLLSYFSNSR